MKNLFKIVLSVLAVALFNNLIKAQSISAGTYYSVFRCSTGTAMSCGWNLQGQLGNGTNTTQPTPIAVSNLTGITKVSAGGTHSLFLKNDGTAWACGYNNMQQLGDGTTANKNVPTQAIGLSGIIDISAGQYHSLFLKNDGTVWACGQNSNGQLGIGSTANNYVTVQVPGLTGIIAVSSGFSHSLFLKNDGTVWACGSNLFGELGIGGTNVANKTSPMQVVGLTNVIAISAGKSNTCHSLFLKSNGTVWACGQNSNGQLGDGTTTNRFAPVQVQNLTNITQIKAGAIHSLFLKADGTVWGCGSNQFGQLGTGAISADVLTPIAASQVSTISEIAAANDFSLFLKSNGTVLACGKNTNGNLGDGTMTNATTPVNVTSLCTVSIGIKENNNEESISIYPNPSNGIFTIELDNNTTNNQNCKVNIVNMLGQAVFTNQITQQVTNFDFNSLVNKGIYFVHIISGENKTISIKKIILQ